MFPADRYQEGCPWDKRRTLEGWTSDRALKLTCTADDRRPLAEAAEFDPPVYEWNPGQRARLRAELDAAFFLLHGLARDNVECILGTFRGAKPDEAAGELFAVDVSILDAYDRLAQRG